MRTDGTTGHWAILLAMTAWSALPDDLAAQDLNRAAIEQSNAWHIIEQDDLIRFTGPFCRIDIERNGFRYGIYDPEGNIVAPAHPRWGLEFSGAPATSVQLREAESSRAIMSVSNAAGRQAEVTLDAHDGYVRFSIVPQPEDGKHEPATRILARTGGQRPAFGLADHGGYPQPRRSPASTQLVPFVNEYMLGSHGFSGRLISNFVIFPRQQFAVVNIEPGPKIVRLTDHENAHGSRSARSMPALYYLFGPPETIYRNFLNIRRQHGYHVMKPKYDCFGVGWEAWGALEWKTSQIAVVEHINTYLKQGYPLSWAVIGSGFWPHDDPALCATTSFGMWDPERYPAPREMIRTFHEQGLKVLLGLRIAFLPGGPFADEGRRSGYFLSQNGQPKHFKIGFPKDPVYLLDTQNPSAIEWYLSLCEKWLIDGVDGFKEDLYGYGDYDLPDNKLDAVNAELMQRGVYVMGRNGYLGSTADLHRIEDFNFDHDQDRGPINALCLSYAGLAYVYPDVIGGAPDAGGLKRQLRSSRAKTYLMREAWFSACCPAMAFGLGPWLTDDPEVVGVTRHAARFHARLQPYIYDAALDTWRTGFPFTLTPMPLAWPKDPQTYELGNTSRRSYQWLIGQSLLAAPLYGNDYATAQSRDVYLPAGPWIAYDTGQRYDGPRYLKAYPLPVHKPPLFVGGKGIIVERAEHGACVEAVVYPISPPGTRFEFTHPDGNRVSTIENRMETWNNKPVIVMDAQTGNVSMVTPSGSAGAVRFELQPDHSYTIGHHQP